MTIILMILSIAAFLAIDMALEGGRKRHAAENALFHRGHTWAYLEDTGLARIGIDDFARQFMGTIDRIELPELHKEVRQGDPLFTVVSGKRKVAFISPIDGEVADIRRDAARAAMVKDNPYRKGYFVTMYPTAMARNLDELRNAAEAPSWIERELARLYEFVGAYLARPVGVGGTLPDGGAYVPGIAAKVDEPVFKEMVRNFLR
jgi:glycine cleavage system H protein